MTFSCRLFGTISIHLFMIVYLGIISNINLKFYVPKYINQLSYAYNYSKLFTNINLDNYVTYSFSDEEAEEN